MIICHSHRFLFIKTRKTAGSSVEIALSRLCGPGDVVTPLVTHLGEEEARREEGGYGPAGYLKTVPEHRGWKEWWRLVRGQRQRRFHQHSTAAQVRALVPASVWNGYRKISIERNPWDRAVSRYWWNRYRWSREGKWDFADMHAFLQYLEREKPEQLSNWSHYAIDDTVVADTMLFYETLQTDLQRLAAELGVDTGLCLPRQKAKGGFRGERAHYTEVLGPAERAIIDRACAREIDRFGYEFGA